MSDPAELLDQMRMSGKKVISTDINAVFDDRVCEKCFERVSPRVKLYSKKKYNGIVYCFKCQKSRESIKSSSTAG